jgi:ribosomal protein S9
LKAGQRDIPIYLREFHDDYQGIKAASKQPILRISIFNGENREEAILAKPPAIRIEKKIAATSDRIQSQYGRLALASSPKGSIGFHAEPYKGSGRIWVNGISLAAFFDCFPKGNNKKILEKILELESAKKIPSNIDIHIRKDGNIETNCNYITLVAEAIAKSLMAYDPKTKSILLEAGIWRS